MEASGVGGFPPEGLLPPSRHGKGIDKGAPPRRGFTWKRDYKGPLKYFFFPKMEALVRLCVFLGWGEYFWECDSAQTKVIVGHSHFGK